MFLFCTALLEEGFAQTFDLTSTVGRDLSASFPIFLDTKYRLEVPEAAHVWQGRLIFRIFSRFGGVRV